MIKSFSPDVLLHPPHRSLPRQQHVEKVIPNNDNSGSDVDIKEILHFKKASYLRQYRDQTKCSFKTKET